jgi:hypothetical protein
MEFKLKHFNYPLIRIVKLNDLLDSSDLIKISKIPFLMLAKIIDP